jgi:hypothetical protein
MKYKGNDIAFKTDKEGNPMVMFIGKLTKEGKIKGERYARTLKADSSYLIPLYPIPLYPYTSLPLYPKN